ncbi:tetratricopeptide repeat protein, partial [Nocardia beijingensis]
RHGIKCRHHGTFPLTIRSANQAGNTHKSTVPDTLTARNNVAIAYQSAGRIDDAIAILEALVPVRAQVLGVRGVARWRFACAVAMASDVRSSVADHRADTRSQCRTGLAGVVVGAVGSSSRVSLGVCRTGRL